MADAGEFEADTLRQGSGDMMPALWDRIVGELGRRETRVMFGAEAAPILLDRFEVRRCVGVGGMGVVFEAFDPDLRRRVALKICKTRVVEARAIEHEARCLAKLSHPNIVAVHEIVRLGADLILVMEFVEGQTLRKWQATTRPDWRELLSRYLDAGQALAAVHAAGLEHGDFKPDNVMVDSSGRVRVVDFGIARYSVESNDAGELAKAGTRAYMAPERIMGKPGGSKADIYAFCVAVWESLHGVRPYAGATEHALLEAILAGKPTRGRATLGMPGRVREVLMKGMAAQPSDRYANLEALLRALHDQVDGRRRRATRACARARRPSWPSRGLRSAMPVRRARAPSLQAEPALQIVDVEPALAERGVVEDLLVQRGVGADALDHHFRQRVLHARDRRLARIAVRDHLGDQ